MSDKLEIDPLLYGDVQAEVVHRCRPRVARTRCGLEVWSPFPGLPLLHVQPGHFYFTGDCKPWSYCDRCWPDQDECGIPRELYTANESN